MRQTLHLLVPGSIDRPSGGSRYDRRMAQELRALGWAVEVTELDGALPQADALAQSALGRALEGCADDALVVIDGLAGCALPEAIERHAARLRLVLLVHLPLADATGLSADRQAEYLDRERRALAAASGGVIVTSRYSARRLADAYGVPAERIGVVLPGTDRRLAASRPQAFASRLLCVAAISQRKGQDLLIEALASLRDLPWRLRLVGPLDVEPEFTAALRQRIDALQLQARIVFTGAVADTADEYRNADLFVLPSRMETYGMVLSEAAAHGLPILSTRCGAIPDTLPADAALLIEPDDVNALSAALRELLTDAGLRERLAAAVGRARFEGWHEAAKEFARVLQGAEGLSRS